MTEYTLEQCLEQQKKVDAGIKHNGEYMPWLAGIKEVIEMCDHLSMIDTWKKQPEPDMKQAFMELVDVFAFVLSAKTDCEIISPSEISETIDYCYDEDLFGSGVIRYLVIAISEGDFNTCIGCLTVMCRQYFNRDYSDIYYYYMGKQTLTRFRQDNGYKEGTYIKIWGEREDNEFLTDALEQGIEIDAVYEHLKTNYERIVIAKAEVE